MSHIGKQLIKALEEAKSSGLVTLHATPDVAKLRRQLKLSQSKFAEIYRINVETLKKWEQHKREPDSISRAYLKCIKNDPITIQKLVSL